MHYIGAKTGRVYAVGRLLARAGEGCVYETPTDWRLLLKVYTSPPGQRTVEKLGILAAFSRKPANTALPVELIVDPATKSVVGYAQPFYRGAAPFTRFLDPKWRKASGVADDLYSLVRIARALAEAVVELHAARLVMGDVSDSNFLVRIGRWSATPTVFVIDCGSVQVSIRSPSGFDVYVSGVGTEAYVAPEVQGTDWAVSERTVYSDAFGVAVLLWRLFFRGAHPFAVASPPHIDLPPLRERIQRRMFPFRPSTFLPYGWRPGPLSPSLDVLPAEIQELLFKTLAASDPRDRPLVGTLAAALGDWEKALHPSVAMRLIRSLRKRTADDPDELWPRVRSWGLRGAMAAGLGCFLWQLPRGLPTLPKAEPTAPRVREGDPGQKPKRPPRPRAVDETLFPPDAVIDLFPKKENRRE